ncbi:MAG TPA: MaoC family dehydratase [Caulobacteraceae bacterium]|jgi:acyl dehydratase
MTDQLCYDDLRPGAVLTSAESEPLSEDEIVAFARRFDPQPFHTDPQAARDTFFGRLVASGWHTAAITMRLMVDAMPFQGGLIGAGCDRLLWPRPVLPGDRLHVRCEVLEMRPSGSRPDQGLVKVRVTTLNQRGEAVQVVTPNMLLPRRQG